MSLPTICSLSEDAIYSVPVALKEGSLSLGATHWETLIRVVLPAALPGILTGAILGLSRAAGETAPIMFTAASVRHIAGTHRHGAGDESCGDRLACQASKKDEIMEESWQIILSSAPGI